MPDDVRKAATALQKKRATAKKKKSKDKPKGKKRVEFPAASENAAHRKARLLQSAAGKKWTDSPFVHPSEALGNVEQFFSTSIPVLDVILTGEVGRGIAAGRFTELLGESDVGKTTLGCYMIKSAQEAGGNGIVIDTESSLSAARLKELGIDLDACTIIEESEIEKILERIQWTIEQMGDTPTVIFWDTIASTTSKFDKGKGIGEGRIARHASALADGFRRITPVLAGSNVALVCCNQRKRGGIGEMFANQRQQDASLGGDAIKFHPTHRIKLKYMKRGGKDATGFVVAAQCLKNKVMPSDLSVTLAFKLNGTPAEFDRAQSLLMTLQRWKLLKDGQFVYTAKDGARLSTKKWIVRYLTKPSFQAEMHQVLEQGFKKLTNREE